ncbi:MAG: Asp-tRNA(Asn)/Glu-tRNA(Gln) amidotransferase subunit GatB [Deltaproteobacteria bacterium]|nr:Asp-tRNA(Asn)/Glu-tRNA(Gln) amidotransferase subunit GatB [Deltaproteobacteria bacterium]
MEFEPVIGLEVHAQLLTKSKIFCSCSSAFGASPNQNTCPVCLGLPGVLPVLNRQVVHFAIKAALALNCAIQKKSIWARKNYFYPDLPKGYQISQYEEPLALGGWLDVPIDGKNKRVQLTRIHMEEDAGKLLHEHGDETVSHVDLNRAGVPLIEIVSEPEIRSAAEAAEYLRQMRSILRYCGVCDGNMDEGSMRCDANVSIRPVGSEKFGTKVELKNMNSFKFVEKAIEYEIERQKAAIAAGEKIVQETRLWDSKRGVTESMRSKEQAHDYRYFPDPDLVPLLVDEKWIEFVKKEMPELAPARAARFAREYQIPEYDAQVLTVEKTMADYFEEAVKAYPAGPKKISNWIMTELLRELKNGGIEIEQSKISPRQIAKLIELIDSGSISGKIAKTVFEEMFQTGKDAEAIIKEKNLVQVSDTGSIEKVIDAVIAANPKQLEQYRSGKDKLFGFFVGQVMKEMKGQGNPTVVNELLKKKLSS